jgi:DNA-binding LacI/PurR family transcriptional regulator
MNGTARVSEGTAARVSAVIKKLNYEPNLTARKLAGGNGGSVALVLEESTEQFFSNPFWKSVVDGFITTAAEHHQHPALIFHSRQDPDQSLVKVLMRGNYDAIAVFGWHHEITVLERSIPSSMRIVFGGRQGDSSRFSYVGVDNVVGGEIATGHLIDQGCTNIVHITGDLSVESGRERLLGYKNAHINAGLKVRERNIIEGDYTQKTAMNKLMKFLKKYRDIDGIFAGNDLTGIGAIAALTENQLSVPRDVKVIGFDGTDLAATHRPALSTVEQPSYLLGSEVARQLILAPSNKLENVMLPLTLIVRNSSEN